MPTLPKFPPSSLRTDPLPPGGRSLISPDKRPYIISAIRRREVFSDGVLTITSERSITLFDHESEDARLTGSTRSLYRRLLALNLPIDVAAGKPSNSTSTRTAQTPPRAASA